MGRRARLAALIEEAMVDCYGEDEQFWGLFCTLEEQLRFPLQAMVQGEAVTVVGLDGERRGLRRGIIARVRKSGWEYTAALAELDIVESDPVSAEWLGAYRCWLGDEG